MSRSRLEFGSSGSIDLMDDIAYSLNFAVADIREPDKRNASYSKTIRIPGSKQNNKLFKHIFEIDIDCNFNPNLKTEARLYVDELLQMKGYLQLMKINRYDDNKLEYEVTIRGNVGNIFTVWADSYLTDLDLSAYDHTYNKTNQKNSWSSTVGTGYVYPMIDYGLSNGLTYNVEHFFPAIYVKQYIDSMFAYAGYTYSSAFFGTDFFKRLIIPYNSTSLRLSTSEVTARLFNAYINTSGSINMPANGLYTSPYTTLINFNAETSDPSNQFDTSTYKFTASNTGNYNFEANLNVRLNSAATSNPTGYFCIIKYTPSTTTYQMLGNVYINNITNTSTTSVYVSASNISVTAGDQVYVGAQLTSNQSSTPNVNISGVGYFRNSVNNIGVFDGNSLLMNDAIPRNIKMKDFFTSIIKMFNLYIETDKTITNKLYIEPRNDFYSAGTTLNWTDKLAIDRDLEIEPMGELNASRYDFKYKEDKDFWNTKYQSAFLEPYGTYHKDVDTDFIKSTKTIDVIFSGTPLVKIGSTDRIISQIIGLDSNGAITDIKNSNLRILYYTLKNTNYSWQYSGTISGTSTETTYPYAGHVDIPLTPTLDISFGVPQQIFYDTQYYTNANLYNTYYKKYIDEITDKDSKIITGYFYLTPRDINILDFRNQFYVDGHLLRLNKVYDYNPLTEELTKCEFIRIKEALAFTAQAGLSIYGNNIHFTSGDGVPAPISQYPLAAVQPGNVIGPGNVIDNTVQNVVVTGRDNYVAPGVKSVTLLSSSGVNVYPGVENVTVINTYDKDITDSNGIYISGVFYPTNQSEQGITAHAGGGQANAYQTSARYNLVETVATTGDSVKTISATLNAEQQFKNVGANSMNVYPKTGEQFRKGTTLLGANVPYAVASRNSLHIYCYEAGIWTD